ncbi:hypothetical protein [Glaciimonas sp. PAMC28666]|uniref:hypothetical protein n=1 Tax=Glaciimonas sp. PAMC28666 TaxID=2807626 RepID=UPI001964DCB0|nr:hypothetical protein [Glaciimonas sp. PAMC28666]QRX81546.1 hypothetical protein JQN73_15460 [Glaciimonas sp. PAMC28666]
MNVIVNIADQLQWLGTAITYCNNPRNDTWLTRKHRRGCESKKADAEMLDAEEKN